MRKTLLLFVQARVDDTTNLNLNSYLRSFSKKTASNFQLFKFYIYTIRLSSNITCNTKNIKKLTIQNHNTNRLVVESNWHAFTVV